MKYVLLFLLGIGLGIDKPTSVEESKGLSETIADDQKDQNNRVAIIYLSRTNNTKLIAEQIHEHVAGELIALELEQPYPEDYKKTVDQVAEENRTGFLPKLKTKVDLSKYDRIYLGFPTWGMQLPPPIKSFLNGHNWKGKIILPFNTNAGYGLGSCMEDIKRYAKQATITEPLSLKGGVERDGIKLGIQGKREQEAQAAVKAWLSKTNQETKK